MRTTTQTTDEHEEKNHSNHRMEPFDQNVSLYIYSILFTTHSLTIDIHSM